MGIGFLVLFAYYIMPLAKPIVFALITAILIERIVKAVQKRVNTSRTTSVLIVFSAFTLAVLAIGSFFITRSIVYIIEFVENFPDFLNKINVLYNKMDQKMRLLTDDLPRDFVKSITNAANETFNSTLNTLRNWVSLENITKLVKAIPIMVVDFIVYTIALVLIMLDLPNIERALKSVLKESTRKNISFIRRKIEETIYGVLIAQFFISLVVFIIAFVGLVILIPVKNAFVMAVVIWIVDLLPIIGSIAVLLPWGIYELFTGSVFLGSGLIILGVLITIFRRVIEPKFMSANIGLSPLAALISIFIGFKIFGVIGLIAGPLVLIIIKSLFEEGIIKLNISF